MRSRPWRGRETTAHACMEPRTALARCWGGSAHAAEARFDGKETASSGTHIRAGTLLHPRSLANASTRSRVPPSLCERETTPPRAPHLFLDGEVRLDRCRGRRRRGLHGRRGRLRRRRGCRGLLRRAAAHACGRECARKLPRKPLGGGTDPNTSPLRTPYLVSNTSVNELEGRLRAVIDGGGVPGGGRGGGRQCVEAVHPPRR